MSVRTFTVRVDAMLVEEAARASKCTPEKFIACAVGTAVLDEFDGGEIEVGCNGAAWTMSSPGEGDAT